MMDKLVQIQVLIKNECYNGGKIESYFYDVHLLAVESCAKLLLDKMPEADKEIVMLGVWLHDLQRIRKIDGDHAEVGAREAVKLLKDYGYSEETQNKVRNIILTHRCDEEPFPDSLEGKILSTADAMSHYFNDFYLTVFGTGKRNMKDFKAWALEKLNRDYNAKIYFDFARDMIKERHEALVNFFSLN